MGWLDDGITMNAKIESTSLGPERIGFTFFLHLKYGAALAQSVGGVALRSDARGVLEHILRIAGVKRWEDLPGKYIRVVSGEPVKRIGHLLNDDWMEFF